METAKSLDLRRMKKSMETKEILCAKALVYEKGVGLHFNLGGYKGLMPMEQTAFTPDGESVKEAAVVTRVNKNVCFVITDIVPENGETVVYISRRQAQILAYENYINSLHSGDIIPCSVSHVDSFGVFCDVGCGITALLPIDFISVSRINSPADRFSAGQNIYACVKSIDDKGKIVLSHKELLGTWAENAALFKAMSTVTGVVRSIESYGIFIELTPNLASLAETCEGIQVGDVVNVYIKSIIPEKMKVKLVIMSTVKNPVESGGIKYFLTKGRISKWEYSTPGCKKHIETVFT